MYVCSVFVPCQGRECAEAARAVPRASAREALQPAHGGRIPALGTPLHLLPRQAPPEGNGRPRSRGVPVASRDRGAGVGVDAESGAVGAAVPLSRGPAKGTAVDGRNNSREATGAGAGGAHAAGSPGTARAAGWHALARREPALRYRDAAAGRAAATHQGRGLRAPRDHGTRRQGRARPAHDAARAVARAAARASCARQACPRARSRGGIRRCLPAVCARAQIPARGNQLAVAIRVSVARSIGGSARWRGAPASPGFMRRHARRSPQLLRP